MKNPKTGHPVARLYDEFLESKQFMSISSGIDIELDDINPMLFPFQKDIVRWALKKGRAAIFADCGMGKTAIQLVWADKISQNTNKPVLILTPLAVSYQTVREGQKFGIECERSQQGEITSKIMITNYERLEYFKAENFSGLVCDESSILKNFNGVRRNAITQFMKKVPYRLLCTATAAPNDYTELGTSSEALGLIGHMDMLSHFFKNDSNSSISAKRIAISNDGRFYKWRFKRHAEIPFWKWVCSWSITSRKPSDLGYEDGNFILPPINIHETIIPTSRPLNGKLFIEPARTLKEQREERKMTLQKRCETVAEKVNHNRPALVWCHYNAEGDLLERIIPDAIQVSGSDPDEKKEKIFLDFISGNLRVLITKPRIGGFGLNFQHCSHITFFPSHSWEQYYQGVRRCWRYGQKSDVTVDIITTEGELKVLKNLQQKSEAADKMFDQLIQYMNKSHEINIDLSHTIQERMPQWL